MPHYSPLRYPGGKNCIFSFVSALFEENSMHGVSYAEPYAGGAGLALRLLFEEYVNKIFINDLDRSIYAFWVTLINEPEKFCEWVKSVDVTVRSWREYREIQSSADAVEIFKLAQSTFFLNRTNVSGVIKGGIIGGLEQKGKYKIDARFNKDELIQRIKKVARYKNRIEVSNDDGLNFISKLNKTNKEIFVYLDPPYYEKGSELYMNAYRLENHVQLSKAVSNLKLRWMVSYDNNPVILQLYKKYIRLIYNLSQNTSNRIGNEVLIFSDKVNQRESIWKLKSPKMVA